MNYTEDRLKRIKIDSLYGKKKHFNAADRIQKHHLWLGIPLVVINVLTGSVLIYVITEGKTNWVKYIPLVLALLSALLGTLQTFFNFPRKVEGHRRIGNRYLSAMKKCDRIQAYVNDGIIDQNKLIQEIETIASDIEAINQDAEAFPTSQKDYKEARDGVHSGEEGYTPDELEL